MIVLVLNAGSSSLKFKLLESESECVLSRGVVERIGSSSAPARFVCTDKRGAVVQDVAGEGYAGALEHVLASLVEGDGAPLASLDDVQAVGHRIAHGGDVFTCSVAIDDDVVATIERFAELAPLHNPPALAVIDHCRRLFGPSKLQVAAFDTAFHQTMPARNYVYPIPYRYYADMGIRRYGFHGTSHKYVSRRAAEFLGKSRRDLKMITCHLGAGASVCAIDHGVSMDTSMGFTPLDGIVMGTRSGSVDPAIITTIMERENLTPAQMDAVLNRESGMLGVSGVSGDLRELKEAVAVGNERAELAYDIFLTSIRRMIGAYFFELAGVDVIVCTAGVGENDPYARRLIFRGLEPFGIRIDQERNMEVGKADRRISTDDSTVEVLVVPTDEEAEIARDVSLIAAGVDISDPYSD
ncbi:acetate/propionate family kinase [Adlercreutzia sp. ZJ141]|uniref:acetate/propionate family kinase n=1 Tax=Adlercreutzia sp. ZJ141 TaxID=2709406 RepID=UPI0013EC57AE|nr:acetate kinase [Adlercreutzia sp. ZJ141]